VTKPKSQGRTKTRDQLRNQELEVGERLHQSPVMSSDNHEKFTRNSKEDRMLELIDNRRALEKLVDWVDKLQNNKTDVNNFFGGLAPEAAIELAGIMFSTKVGDKVKLEAIKDFLDRAGYSKVQKHAVASVDTESSKEAILSLIAGKSGKIPDIEIIDDSEDSY
jgi:hypothetical protein